MNWRSVLLENWPYKLTALLLGLLLWVNVAVEERAERAVAVATEWVVTDTAFVLVEAPEEVLAVFQGRGSEILDVATASPRVRYVLDSVSAGTRTVRIPPDSVSYPRSANVRVTGIRPPTVQLRIEERVSARLPVRPDLRVRPAPGFRLLGSPRIEPESVTVFGARSEVGSLTDLRAAGEELRDVRGTTRVDLAVELPEGHGSLRVQPQVVLATVRVDTVVGRTYRLPVEDTSGLTAGGLVPDPDSVTVTVRGAESVVRSLAREAVRAVLVGSPPGEPGRRLRVGFVLPDTSLSATAEPASAVLRRPGGS